MHIYSFIRKDIPLADQIVQTAHSAFHAGEKFGDNKAIPSLILLGLDSHTELLDTTNLLKHNDIKFSMFYEPDDDMGYTSITTEPIDNYKRKLLSGYKLWKAA